jgi:hypothetical protein
MFYGGWVLLDHHVFTSKTLGKYCDSQPIEMEFMQGHPGFVIRATLTRPAVGPYKLGGFHAYTTTVSMIIMPPKHADPATIGIVDQVRYQKTKDHESAVVFHEPLARCACFITESRDQLTRVDRRDLYFIQRAKEAYMLVTYPEDGTAPQPPECSSTVEAAERGETVDGDTAMSTYATATGAAMGSR